MPDFAMPEPLPRYHYDDTRPLKDSVCAFEEYLLLILLRKHTTIVAASRDARMNVTTFRRLVRKHRLAVLDAHR